MSAEPLVVPRVAPPTPSPSPSAEAPAGRSRRTDRIAILDGLRLVAALMVVTCHYTANRAAWGNLDVAAFPETAWATRYGWLGDGPGAARRGPL